MIKKFIYSSALILTFIPAVSFADSEICLPYADAIEIFSELEEYTEKKTYSCYCCSGDTCSADKVKDVEAESAEKAAGKKCKFNNGKKEIEGKTNYCELKTELEPVAEFIPMIP